MSDPVQFDFIQGIRDYLSKVSSLTHAEDRTVKVLDPYAMLLSHAIPAWERVLGVTRMPVKACYDNAYRMVSHRPYKYAYVEGYAAQEKLGLPLSHAWVVDRDTGMILDPTWPEDSAVWYFGIPIKLDVMYRSARDTSYAGIIYPGGIMSPLIYNMTPAEAGAFLNDPAVAKKIARRNPIQS